MKKISVVILIISLGLWLGCGGDDKPTDNDDTVITITAATGTAAPARLSVDDTVWNRIAPTTVPMAASRFSSAGKIRPKTAQAVAASVDVQVLVASDTLFLRLVWDDDTWDRWPGRFEVTSFDTLPPDTLAHFTPDDLSHREDQVMVFLRGDGYAFWDVWNWRMTTTGAGYLAEGFILSGVDLLSDNGGTPVAISNVHDTTGQPKFMHLSGPDNQNYRLPQSMAVEWSPYLRWKMGDLLAGWVINDTLWQSQIASSRGSRFDIGSYSRHSSGEYVVVLHRALLTGSEDDIDLTGPVTLAARIGITNNADFSMGTGDSRQGFSSTFELVIP